MRIGRIIIAREHPDERALRRWGQLSPALKELVSRATRSVAKDAVQDVMEAQGLVYNPEGHPSVVQHTTAGLVAADNPHYISRSLALRALADVHHGVETCRAPDSTDDECAKADDAIKQAYALVRGHE